MMRVRVAYTMRVDDDFRLGLACYDGEHGKKATRLRLQELARMVGETEDADIMDEWADCQVCHPAPKPPPRRK